MLDPSILVGHTTTPLAGNYPLLVPGSAAPAIEHDQTKQIEQEQQVAKTLASVLALQSSLDAFNTLDHAAQNVAESVKEECGASEVVLLWRTQQDKGLSIVARSDRDTVIAATQDDAHFVIAAAEEISVRDSFTTWPIAEETDRVALMAVRQLAEHQSIETISSARLSFDESPGRGVLMVMNATHPSSCSFLRVASVPLTGALTRIADEQPTRIDAAVKAVLAMTRGRRGQVTLLSLVALTLLLLLPIRYRVLASLKLQPVERRFIAVPFDGPLQHVHVKPGDMVAKGDLLASMDPKEIEYEIAGNQAEWNRAEQERKSLMVKHDFAGSKLASLDTERLRIQTDLLSHQLDQSQIRSPIDGVIVSGDVMQSEGMPMSRGESLFEVAPLGKMVVEIAVPETDVAEVRPGMDVTFYVHAFPNRKLVGTIERIHPKAELRDNDNVFVAEVALEDPDGIFRPGMQGRASVIGDRHTLVWNYFHPAYYAVRRYVGW